jgi:hypothetical protein
MALDIETFSNVSGGATFFKAVGHPIAAESAAALLGELAEAGPVAVYDPLGQAHAFSQIHDLSALDLAGLYVQSIDAVGTKALGATAQPVTNLPASGARAVLILSFDSGRLADHIRHLVPNGARLASLDDIALPKAMLTNPSRYLDPLNFATNFAFFRDADGQHTRIVTANYWAGYGAGDVRLWARLIGEDGGTLAEWEQPLPPGAGGGAVPGFTVDSAEVRARFGLDAFTGQLFLHVIGAKGHEVVKYALDTYGDAPEVLSCTHDANAWPADRYAGLPAPRDGETVVLWVQNSHPCPIPARGVGLNLMGDEAVVWLDREIPPFGTYALDTRELLPAAAHPLQIEVQAGKYFVRPRYEITAAAGRVRIAHANVERVDLKPDPRIAEISNLMGKGYVLPAPVLPPDRFASALLPTPMSTGQDDLPVSLLIYDAAGNEVHRHRFGRLGRADSVWLELDDLLKANGGLGADFGHMELLYDFADGGSADGWLHAIFRYRDRTSGHEAETSFGAHIFNTVLTYKGEPQSYAGPAPGLSTRLFLRVAPNGQAERSNGWGGTDTLCHLIYTSATQWHATSDTALKLVAGDGTEVAERTVRIPLNGSLHWRVGEMFEADALAAAGDGAYVVIRDTTCRLFGYHGLIRDGVAFSFDHMFGF